MVHPDGTPWFAMGPRNTVGKRLTTGEFKEFGLGQGVLDPIGLTVDAARDVWVAAQQHIVVLGAAGEIKDTIPVPNGRLFGATSAPTGEVWFTAETSSQVLRASR